MLQEARDCQKKTGPHKGSLAHAASLGAIVNRTDLLSPTQARQSSFKKTESCKVKKQVTKAMVKKAIKHKC